MKKVLAVITTLLLAMGILSGCGSSSSSDTPAAEPANKLEEVLQKGYIVLATSPDYPQAEYVDLETGEIRGSDVMLAKYIANSLGVELKIESMDFGGVIVSLDTGKSDIAFSGFGYTTERAENYELTHGYQASSVASHHSIIVLAENKDKFNSLDDFKGLKINAQANSLQHMYCEDQLPDTELELVTTIDQAILNLTTGKVDAVALDTTTAKNYASTSDGMIVSLYDEIGLEFDLTMYAELRGNVGAIKKGETELLNAVNAIIDYALDEGIFADMYYCACNDSGIEPEGVAEDYVYDGPDYETLWNEIGKADIDINQFLG